MPDDEMFVPTDDEMSDATDAAAEDRNCRTTAQFSSAQQRPSEDPQHGLMPAVVDQTERLQFCSGGLLGPFGGPQPDRGEEIATTVSDHTQETVFTPTFGRYNCRHAGVSRTNSNSPSHHHWHAGIPCAR